MMDIILLIIIISAFVVIAWLIRCFFYIKSLKKEIHILKEFDEELWMKKLKEENHILRETCKDQIEKRRKIEMKLEKLILEGRL